MSKLKNNKKKVIIKSVKKQGFTLVELLGVIIILGVLALLIIPTIDKSLKAGKQKLYDNQIENIELAANSWALDNLFALPENDDEYIIVELGQIKASGYIDKEIINPLTGELFPNDTQIKITKKGKKYVYEVIEGSGTPGNSDIPNTDVPVITLNGSKIINIGINGTYTELGATAKTIGGTDVSSNIEITGTVDTTTEGTYYIKYNITNNGYKAKEVVRTVNVIDKNPAINLLPNKTEGYSKAITVEVVATPAGKNTIRSLSYKVNGGEAKSVVGNKITLDQDGTYTLEVTAKDNEGNTKTVTSGIYRIDVTPPTITFAEGDTAGITLTVNQVASYDLKTGVSVTDNNAINLNDVTTSGDLSAIVGDYTITYTVTDKAGNTTTETRKITVKVAGVSFTEKMQNSSEVAALDPDGNLRYVGPTPNNYVQFNNELWRIIGVFDGQAKIIRDQPYNDTAIAWDEDDGSCSNNWATASLQLALNNTTDGYITTIQTNDPTSYGYIDLNHVWNIGACDGTYTTTATRSEFYTAERSGTPAGAEGSTQLWTGTIGLMYPSDYGYASGGSSETCEGKEIYNWDTGDYKTECAKKSWLFDENLSQWTLTPRGDNSNGVLGVSGSGFVSRPGVHHYIDARPVLYLKSDTKIVGGLGTYDQPFELGA